MTDLKFEDCLGRLEQIGGDVDRFFQRSKLLPFDFDAGTVVLHLGKAVDDFGEGIDDGLLIFVNRLQLFSIRGQVIGLDRPRSLCLFGRRVLDVLRFVQCHVRPLHQFQRVQVAAEQT